MKKTMLSFWMILGCLVLTAAFSVHSVSAADPAELIPMDLNGTQWAIELVVSVDKNGEKKIQEDTLVFQDNKFYSEIYEKKGYARSNYALTVTEDDVTSFGTMQVKGKDTAFWKGQLTGDMLSGSAHFQYFSGKNETFYYTGQMLEGSLKRKSKPKPRPAVVEPPTAQMPPPPPVVDGQPIVFPIPAESDESVKPIIENSDQE